jgi:hypothetical protein
MIEHNRGMKRLWLSMATVVLLPSGCTPGSKPSRPTSSAEKPPAESAANLQAKSPEKQPVHRRVDEFNLPLEIEMEAPEAPPDVQKPSPPIKEQPNSP